MPIANEYIASTEDFHRTSDHIHQFLETAQKHGADGKDAVIGAIAGIRLFVEDNVDYADLLGELDGLAIVLKS